MDPRPDYAASSSPHPEDHGTVAVSQDMDYRMCRCVSNFEGLKLKVYARPSDR